MATMDFVVKVQSSSGGTVTLNSSPFEIRRPALRAGDRRETEVENRLEIRLTDLHIRETGSGIFFPCRQIRVDESDPEVLKYKFNG